MDFLRDFVLLLGSLFGAEEVTPNLLTWKHDGCEIRVRFDSRTLTMIHLEPPGTEGGAEGKEAL